MHRLLLAALVLAVPGTPAPPAPTPAAVLDSAIARMGGRSALEGIVRVRREMMTQWQRITFDDRPYMDGPSYEMHSDVRDYSVPAWRNTRKFPSQGKWTEITDIVRDTVSARQAQGKWGPLSIAYVDERHELFTFAPERLLLNARAATDLKLLPDTTIGGLVHQRVSGTLGGLPSVIFVRQSDGLPAFVRFRAAQDNDFGLVPWGNMEVEVWYSRWARFPSGVVLPGQWDTRRVGRPYKRITVLWTAFDSVATADSFSISDSVRTAYLATSRKPMHDTPIDSAKVIEESWATFGSFGSPAGAVKIGGQWWFLETGQADLNVKRAADWLAARGGQPAGAFITATSSANGGMAWLVAEKRQVRMPSSMAGIASAILRNHGQSPRGATIVQRGAWQRAGTDSVWVEPIDYPDMPGAMYIYVPSLKWAYSATALAPLQMEYFMRRLRERQFAVERTGHLRSVLNPAPVAVSLGAGNRK